MNLALEARGAQVILATSSDERHAPECIIDGSDATFWATTGMFPQEFVIAFPALTQVHDRSRCWHAETASVTACDTVRGACAGG